MAKILSEDPQTTAGEWGDRNGGAGPPELAGGTEEEEGAGGVCKISTASGKGSARFMVRMGRSTLSAT